MKCNGFFYIVPIFEAPVNGRKSSGRYILQRIAKGRLAVSRWCVIGAGPAVWGQTASSRQLSAFSGNRKGFLYAAPPPRRAISFRPSALSENRKAPFNVQADMVVISSGRAWDSCDKLLFLLMKHRVERSFVQSCQSTRDASWFGSASFVQAAGSLKGKEEDLFIYGFAAHGRVETQYVRRPIPSQSASLTGPRCRMRSRHSLIFIAAENVTTGTFSSPTRGEPRAVSCFCFRYVRIPIHPFIAPDTSRLQIQVPAAPETALHTCKRKIPFSSPSIPRPRPQKGCRDHRIVRKIPPLCGVLSFSISPKHRSPVRSG